MDDSTHEFYSVAIPARPVIIERYFGRARDVEGGVLVFLPGLRSEQLRKAAGR